MCRNISHIMVDFGYEHMFNVLRFTALQIRTGSRSITANLWPLTAHIYYVMIIVNCGFSKKSFFIFRSSSSQMFFKTGVIRNFAVFTGKYLCWSLLLIKLQALQPATLFQPRPKRSLNTGDSCDNFEIFTNNLFMEHLRRLLLSVS